MDVYECIRTRRTVREFKPDPVPEAIVQKILQAGRWAPSSSNTQPWHFVVVSAREDHRRARADCDPGAVHWASAARHCHRDGACRSPTVGCGPGLTTNGAHGLVRGSGNVFRRSQSGRTARRHQGTAGDTRGDGTHHRHAVWVSAGRAPRARDTPQTDGRDRPPRTIRDRVCPPLSLRGRSTRDLPQPRAAAHMRSMAWASLWKHTWRPGCTSPLAETTRTSVVRGQRVARDDARTAPAPMAGEPLRVPVSRITSGVHLWRTMPAVRSHACNAVGRRVTFDISTGQGGELTAH